jgi:hypothetical protein
MAEGGFDPGISIEMHVPTRAVAYLATCSDPMQYTGQVLGAEEMVSDLDL